MQLDDFNFALPKELIARYPTKKRSGSRLLYLPNNSPIAHHKFENLADFLQAGDLLVFNDTRVIPARLIGHKRTGGRVECLVERILDDQHIMAQISASKTPKVNDEIIFEQGYVFTVLDKKEQFYHLRNESAQKVLSIIEQIGQIPLPPYMDRDPEESDHTRYQTIYAKHKGSVAAPTAGFHFDQDLMQALQNKNIQFGYLTLHVGAGTFLPVRTNDIRQHTMHNEYFEIDAHLVDQIQLAKQEGRRVVAVGTTSLRALETASQISLAPYAGETNIFIFPGYVFRCIDLLITNFHLPCSTLLMLVCAFGGYKKVMRAYENAVHHRYRFYSYGDAMLVEYCHPERSEGSS